MASLRGNLGVKSSALAPTACKLSTQYLVLDHMTNHYNKIAKAKSAIDNRPPKSLSSSQKLRDRKTRQRTLSPQRTRPLSRNSLTHEQDQGDLEEYQEFLNEEPADEEERLAYSIMKSTLGKKTSDSHKATYNSDYPSHIDSWGSDQPTNNYEHVNNFTKTNQSGYGRPMSARSGRSVRSTTSTQRGTRVPINHADPAKVTYNGDVIEKRAHCFTEPAQPFTPRTLKTKHESRLKNSKCYNPPNRSKSLQNGTVPSASHSYVSDETSMSKTHPQPQPRQRSKLGHTDDLGETMPTSQLSESMLMDITLQSRDGRRLQNEKGEVPPLAISMDVDHLNWIKEQASKAQVRARNSGKFQRSLAPQQKDDEEDFSNSADPHSLSNSVRLETLKKEEEQKYLAFAKEVTDDVLATGISSDRVLNKLFENHIERRKGDLDEDRMRAVVKDLKKNLGLKEQLPTDMEYEKRSQSRQSDDGASGKLTPKALSRHSRDTSGKTTPKTLSRHSGEASGRSTPKALSRHSGSASGKSTPKAMSRHSGDNLSESSLTKERPVQISEVKNSLAVNGNETLDSTSTMKFGQTGDVFSTIHSEGRFESELSEGELDMSKKDTAEENDDLSATQALKQYQMDLTAKEASLDGNGEASGSEFGRNSEDALGVPESNGRPATGEMRETQDDYGELSTTGQITIETSHNDLLTSVSGNNATDTSPGSELTPGSGTQNSVMSPGRQSNNSQESNSYSQLMPQTKPRARRRMRANNSSSSEMNGSNLSKTRNGMSTLSTESWSEKESENGEADIKPSRLRRATKSETINKVAQNDEVKTTRTESIEDNEYASDYEEESAQDTHRTSDEDF